METPAPGWCSDGLWPQGPRGMTQGGEGAWVAEESAYTSSFVQGPELASDSRLVLMMFQCPFEDWGPEQWLG